MASWDGLNRRKFPRINYPCLVIIRQSQSEEASDVILTHTENIGIGGVCVIVKKDLKVFTEVELELDLLDLGNHIKCRGRVVWNIQRRHDDPKKPLFYDIGVEFVDISEEQKLQLEDIICRLLNKQPQR